MSFWDCLKNRGPWFRCGLFLFTQGLFFQKPPMTARLGLGQDEKPVTLHSKQGSAFGLPQGRLKPRGG